MAAILLRSSYRQRVPLTRRASALGLALAAAALVILALIELGIVTAPPPNALDHLHIFDVPLVPAPVRTVSRTVKPAGSRPPKAVPKPQPKPAAAPTPPAFILMDSASFAAADIGKIAPAADTKDDGAGGGKDSVAA